jgi:hypothetical protein
VVELVNTAVFKTAASLWLVGSNPTGATVCARNVHSKLLSPKNLFTQGKLCQEAKLCTAYAYQPVTPIITIALVVWYVNRIVALICAFRIKV